ncbi:microcystin degradation protein MlrC [Prosthecobacter fusiformis]|uniref:Microcystin degradation protein MlrC n=1 Tax=Prosthecobacter fusiformis TaxID=48464 RepID=A0A4R7RRC3_9BACT|nr:M81 family metallopeptidase [Prosthecobacter fusiformis]TDU68144.1 microcystin degradation protein MlrC [Prosthecobacter fusiformis]
MNSPSRILIAGLFHETHTFLDGFTVLADFAIRRGDEILDDAGDASPLGGVLELAESFGWEMLPTVDYRAQPGAMVEDLAVEAFWADFLDHAAPHLETGIDAIYLFLHGAMVSPSFDDVEGELLQRLRALPWAAQIPVFGVFDPHANFTPRMASLSDCLVAFRENPHTDARKAARDAARLLQRCLTTGEKPNQQYIHPPLMWPPTGTGTAREPMKTLEAMAREIESDRESGIWSVSVVAGFSFADTPHTGVSFVIAATVDVSSQLQKLSDAAWAMREQGTAPEPPLSHVIGDLVTPPPGLTVLVEPADNIGAGAPGDCTALMRALIHWRIPNCAVCMHDAEAVATARQFRNGDRTMIAMGGKGSRLDAGPVQIEVEVLSHSDGKFDLEDTQSHFAAINGSSYDMGPCGVVRHKELTILLTSIKTPPNDLGQWRSQGLEPSSFSVIGVKAAVSHHQAYDSIATQMIFVDTPGPCSSHLQGFPYEKVQRPIYPLDEMS